MARSVLVTSPEEVLALSAEGVDRLLTELESSVPMRPAAVRLAPKGATSAMVFGDSHGDWRSTGELVARFEAASPPVALVGLGDYIDRSPDDSPGGSAVNALFLLSAAARYPDRVLLLRGNHELARRLGVGPHTLPKELVELWGPDPARYDRLMGLLERGPLAATTRSGAFLSHAGFPRTLTGRDWESGLDPTDETTLRELTWAECDASRIRRGAIDPWGQAELDRFLRGAGLSVLLRGHDPDLTGRPCCEGRVLTVHTCRFYERFGGVLFAALPLEGRLASVEEIPLVHLASEGKTFPRTPRPSVR